MKKFTLVFSVFIFSLVNAQISLSLPEEKNKYDILLLSGTVKPDPLAGKLSSQRIEKEEVLSGRYFRIIQFLKIPTDQEKRELKATGVDLLVYLPNYSFFAAISEATIPSSLNTLANIRTVLPVRPEYKLHPNLKNDQLPADAEVVPGKADLTLIYFKGIPAGAMEKALQSKIKGIKILEHDAASQMIKVRVKKKYVSKVATVSGIQYVEPVEQIKVENYTAITGHRSNTINNATPGGLTYDGTGVGVLVGDGGACANHVDFTGRIKGAVGSYYHSTHVAGIIGGAGNLHPLLKGHAPGVNMIYRDWHSGIASIGAIAPLYHGVDSIRVTNHSLGEGVNLGYTATARESDVQVDSLPSLFNVHSGGNYGPNWYRITGGFKAGKNAIAVGNLDLVDGWNSSSSRGPSRDGRIKPDICTKGTNVGSTAAGNSYATYTGTSMQGC